MNRRADVNDQLKVRSASKPSSQARAHRPEQPKPTAERRDETPSTAETECSPCSYAQTHTTKTNCDDISVSDGRSSAIACDSADGITARRRAINAVRTRLNNQRDEHTRNSSPKESIRHRLGRILCGLLLRKAHDNDTYCETTSTQNGRG